MPDNTLKCNSSDTIGAVFNYKKLHLSVEYILKIW